MVGSEQNLLEKACQLSGQKDEHTVLMNALQGYIDMLEFERDKNELFEHLEQGIADAEAGRFVSLNYLKKHMEEAIG